MTPDALAQTHGAAFGSAGWPADHFERYLSDPKIHISGNTTCFAVFRLMGPEAEILTLATHPNAQGRGQATAMLKTALSSIQNDGVKEVFLEVSDKNSAAIALYQRAGFSAFSERPRYYADGSSAICMKAELSVTFY